MGAVDEVAKAGADEEKGGGAAAAITLRNLAVCGWLGRVSTVCAGPLSSGAATGQKDARSATSAAKRSGWVEMIIVSPSSWASLRITSSTSPTSSGSSAEVGE